jgi:hypothetical protein
MSLIAVPWYAAFLPLGGLVIIVLAIVFSPKKPPR